MHNRLRLKELIVALLMLALASCGTPPSGATSVPAQPSTPSRKEPTEKPIEIKPTLESIQNNFVNIKCLACHQMASNKNRYIVLKDISQIIEGSAHTSGVEKHRDIIKPGCPKQSLFLTILTEGKMPPSEKVNESEIKAISSWIIGLKSGANCDDGEPPDRI